MQQVTVLTVFVASPGDVAEEREAVSRCVAELNEGVAKARGVRLELVRWKTSVRPGLGRPQGVVNAQTGPMQAHALFVGIMWSRFGTSTGVADSGTEEEFRLAKESFEHHGRPEVIFYFSEQPLPVGGVAAMEQALKVAKFREEVQKIGIVGTYKYPADFADRIRHDLTNWLLNQTQETPGVSPQAEIHPTGIPQSTKGPARVEDSGMWTILGDGFLTATQITQQGKDTIELILPALTSAEDSAARNIAKMHGPIAFAQGSDAALVEVTDTQRVSNAQGAHWTMMLRVTDTLEGGSYTDIATTGYSGDRIAELRVKRALLNEVPVKTKGGEYVEMNGDNSLLMGLISGINSPIKVERGAIPDLAEKIDPDSPEFLALARLYSVLLVRGSYAVGSVEYLILERSGSDEVKVEFRGQRPRAYGNVEPPIIAVSGTCRLRD